jgi:nitrogen fixation NifU-like protein
MTDDLYREIVLDHYKTPRHHGKLSSADLVQPGANPLCGDDLELSMNVRDGKIQEICFDGHGCSISQASASMMTEAVAGKSLAEVEALIAEFKAMMLEGKNVESLPEPLEDAKALEGVKQYPARVKCAVLAWNTLLEALKKIKK